MKIGVSTYSFLPLLQKGEMSMADLFAWTRDNGGTHVELATLTTGPGLAEQMTYELGADRAELDSLVAASEGAGIPLSGLCIPASFLGDSGGVRAQIDRAKRYVDLCAELGVGYMRHDVVPWSRRLADTAEFEAAFPGIVEACREIAEHGAARGVVTSIEDHGFFMNGSDRLLRLRHAVDHPNFKMTLDVGNFLCVDEDALIGTQACLPHAAFVHVKDFHVRRHNPGPGWLETYGGQYILGSIFGFGNLDTREILAMLLRAGYDGYVSLEFEGLEPTLLGIERGLGNINRILEDLRAEMP